jgi:acetoin utilization protein AcuB
MTQRELTVQDFMTASPHTVGAEQTLATAHAKLREYGIRHLPVLRGGELVGMLTERDLALIEGIKEVDPQQVRVEEAMSPNLYTVAADTPLERVADEMARKKYGSAIVAHNGRVVGVLTTVDVCRALAQLLRGK